MPTLDRAAAAGHSRTKSAPAVSGIRSPKRSAGAANHSRAEWFRYYAGYSAGFVEDTIDHLNLKPGAILLDPWLGTGTTSEVAIAKGYQIRGYDLNPAMLLVARARLLPTAAAADVSTLVDRICHTFELGILRSETTTKSEIDDPLEQWLQPASARAFRILESSIAAVVSNHSYSSGSPIWKDARKVQPTVAFFYVGLFQTLRHFVSKYQSSNPTWVKVSKGNLRIQLSMERIYNRFLSEIMLLQEALKSEARIMPVVGKRRCITTQASSTRLPISSMSVDAVLTSPPYCTRIDYVRATLPELAVIRFPNGESIRRLREQMIGTPTISKGSCDHDRAWGHSCNDFLSKVEAHSSKASSTYYIKYYRQYFASAYASLREIDRVLNDSGQCVLVVQDSYYKDVPNDLPTIFCEMAQGFGWKLNQKIDFHVKRTLAGVNPVVKQYRSDFSAVESALIFRK
jgi:DNA modification methylase